MAQILIGKLLPNLKVTLGSDEESGCSEVKDNEFYKEEREYSNTSNVEVVRSWMESLQNPKVYKNKSGGFTTGLDLISQENTGILDKRAERFGLEKEECSVTPILSSLYESMGICIENRQSSKMKNLRLDALHMRGVDDLNTDEIFHYFQDYGPSSVEWINDFSCNVVWLDETSCARALLGLSKPLCHFKQNTIEKAHDQDGESSIKNQESSSVELNDQKAKGEMDMDDDSQIKSSSTSKTSTMPLDIPIPPGHWRLATSHPKARTILLRFATKDDKKLPGAEKRSNFYKKYGNPNYGGMKGLISSSRKRKIQAAANKQFVEKESSSAQIKELTSSDGLQSDSSASRVSNSKPPRMRMYADDEEHKPKKSWFQFDFTDKQRSVHSRLGSKYTRDDLCHLGSNRKSQRNYGALERNDAYRGRDHLNSSSRQKDRRKRNWSSKSQVDLRTKLKKLRNNDVNKYYENDFVKKHSIIANVKEGSRSDYKKKHQSPLCADNEDYENSSSDDK